MYITKEEKDVLENMESKTRQLIRKNERNNTIDTSNVIILINEERRYH